MSVKRMWYASCTGLILFRGEKSDLGSQKDSKQPNDDLMGCELETEAVLFIQSAVDARIKSRLYRDRLNAIAWLNHPLEDVSSVHTTSNRAGPRLVHILGK